MTRRLEQWKAWAEMPPTSTEELLQQYAEGKRDFEFYNLRSANLAGANLSGATFHYSSLIGANLRGANLQRTRFLDAVHLQGAKLIGACLNGADFRGAILDEVSLEGSDLTSACFSGGKNYCADSGLGPKEFAYTVLQIRTTGFSIRRARLGATVWAGMDLTKIRGLRWTKPMGPSVVDSATLELTAASLAGSPKLQRDVEAFLCDCGLSDFDLDLFRSRVGKPIEFYSCFISHSSKDKRFARRLHHALQARGIRCWFDEKALVPGDDLHERINQGIRLWDKMVLVCSENSLRGSWWVDAEITTALEKEQVLMRERGEKVLAMIPLDLDGYLFAGEVHGKASTIRSRVCGDFKDWDKDHAKFERELERLVTALRADAGDREAPPPPRL